MPAVAFRATPTDDSASWDADAAILRVRKWASSDGSGDWDTVDLDKVKQAYAWWDPEATPSAAGKLPHHDIRDGRLVVVWGGVRAAMAALMGARGGVDIPATDRRAVYNHLARHYQQFDREAPELTERQVPWTFSEISVVGEDGGPRSKVQLMRVGKFRFPGAFGQAEMLEVTPGLFEEMITNFHNDARGQALPINADHQPGPAYGWIEDLETVDDVALWATVSWTDLGEEAIRGRRYRYMSVEFYPDYVDPEGLRWGAVLVGAALTNLPAIKHMEPVMLGEDQQEEEPPVEGTSIVERLREALGEPDEERVLDRVQKMQEEVASLRTRVAELERERCERVIAEYLRAGKLTPAMLSAGGGHLRKLAEADLDAFRDYMDVMPVVVPMGEVGTSVGSEEVLDPDEQIRREIRRIQMEAAGRGESLSYVQAAEQLERSAPHLVRSRRGGQ